MLIHANYDSPLGAMTLLSDDHALRGLWFNDQRYFGAKYPLATLPAGTSQPIRQAQAWLAQYFTGLVPTVALPQLAPEVTAYRQRVLTALQRVPYGQTVTYQALATQVALPPKGGSARAVGGAVGHNPIVILIPCHRVVGQHGELTGYAGGLARKRALLELERSSQGDEGGTFPGWIAP